MMTVMDCPLYTRLRLFRARLRLYGENAAAGG